MIDYYMCKIFKSLSFIVVLLTASHGFSQIEFMGEAALKGIVSSNEKSPFWFHSNQRGRVTDSTNLAAWLTAKTKYETNSGLRLEFGGGVLFEDSEDKIVIDELYVQFENTWLKIVGGRKQQKELYNGLSATNENILYSLNSRPIPGIEFSTLKPFRLSESLSIEATLGEYFLENDRYIKNARLHHKSMAITYAPNENWEFTYGLQHFAQWGGTKPNGNKEPQGLKDYVKIFFLRKKVKDFI